MKVVRAADTTTEADTGHFDGSTWHQRGREGPVGRDGLRASVVTFPPGVRTHWHRHERGQLLYIMTGRARVGVRAEEDGPVGSASPGKTTTYELSAGDRVIVEPRELHWHGAAPNAVMSHVSVVHEETDWGEYGPATPEDYRPSPDA